MALRHLLTIAEYNVRTLRTSPLAELSGSLGDLGTLLPLMIALALQGSIDLPTTLVFSGLTNILTGAWYGLPLPVQPMKAIAAIAISQDFSQQETMAAGLTMGIVVFILSATGLLSWLNKIVPIPVVKGIQVGAGLALVISAGSSMIKPLTWVMPLWDSRLLAMSAFAFLVIAGQIPKLPYALIIFTIGTVISAIVLAHTTHDNHPAGIWHPSVSTPDAHAWRVGAIDAAIPQLPLTTLNSILAVVSLSDSLFPTFPETPSTTSVGFSVALANLIGCWFGAMPVCHGSGGLAGQYRFGARSGASIIILGTIKLLLGLFVGSGILPLLQQFPKGLLGIMVLAAGVELAKVGQSVGESTDLWDRAEADNNDSHDANETRTEVEREQQQRWMVMLITVAGCLAFKNDFVGFVAGMVWHWALRISDWMARARNGSVRLAREQGTSNLLDRGSD